MFTINAYIENPGSDVLADWYEAHPANQWAKLWAKYYARMLYLRQQPRNGWTEPYFHLFSGKEGVGRVRLDYDGIAYRHLGFFGPAANEFTLLYVATEKNHVYTPKGCIDVAVTRMKSVYQDRTRIREATIRGAP